MSKLYKVIFHIDAIDNWEAALGNITNTFDYFAEEDDQIEVEVLANSEAVEYYNVTNSMQPDLNKLSELADKGVRFVACNNSLTKKDISPDDLYSIVEIVPAGVVELTKKQTEGFAYIKP